MPHKSHKELKEELEKAQKQVKVGSRYSHFKNPENFYKVISLGIQEATDKICVIYQAEYIKDFIFVRDLDSWLEKPEVEDKKVKRFKLVDV